MASLPRLRLAVALVVSAAIVLVAPFLRALQEWLQDSLGKGYITTLGAGFAVGILVSLALAVSRIRTRRLARYGLLAFSLGLMALQIFGFNRGSAVVDAVERIHFLFYGLVAFLFFQVFRLLGGLPAMLATLLAVGAVGIVDELLQWFVPVRTGDVSDVVLNFYAGICGLLFSLAVTPLAAGERGARAGSYTTVARLAAGIVLLFASFLHLAHLGYCHYDPELDTVFRSFFTLEQLEELSRRRHETWSVTPPGPLEPTQKEDYYYTEAGWRVQYRNRANQLGMTFDAWKEERLLEKYYAPMLEIGHGLSPEERRAWEARSPSPDPHRYSSPADHGRVWVVPSKPVLWSVSLVVAALLLLLPVIVRRRSGRQPALEGRAEGSRVIEGPSPDSSG